MRRFLVIAGLGLLLIGGGMIAMSFALQAPAREALPTVNGTVVATWRYVQRSGTDLRIQIAPAQGEPQTLWVPIAQVSPGMVRGIAGREAMVRHASTGQVMEMIVDGRPVIEYAVTANKRSGALESNRWTGFGLFMVGLTLASVGLVFGR